MSKYDPKDIDELINLTHVILDFDGVATIIEEEAAGYLEHYPKIFAERASLDEAMVEELAKETRAKIKKDPGHLMRIQGHAVCRANVTPYDVNRAAFTEIIQTLKLPDKIYDTHFLHEIHKAAYEHTGVVFRDDAKKFLEKLLENYTAVVVTSSGAEGVSGKLKMLGVEMDVYGSAKKYNIDENFDIQEELKIKGCDRGILLRRKNYFEKLELLAKQGFSPFNTAVIGDVYEHDLALPEFLGYKVILLNTPAAADYEIEHLINKPNGAVVDSLMGVFDVLSKLSPFRITPK